MEKGNEDLGTTRGKGVRGIGNERRDMKRHLLEKLDDRIFQRFFSSSTVMLYTLACTATHAINSCPFSFYTDKIKYTV